MAISKTLNRRVRAQIDEDEEEHFSELSGSENQSKSEAASGSESGSEEDEDSEIGSEGEDEESQISDSPEPDINATLQEISFGALAKAQVSLGKRKRSNSNSTPAANPLDEIRQKIRSAKEAKEANSKAPKSEKPHRTSKHAPTIQSSKYAVTRKRTVVEPPNAPKARDPRFDSVVLKHGMTSAASAGTAAAASKKNYEFLDTYRKSELAELKKKMAKTKNAEEKEELKGTIRSLGDQQRAFDRKEREKEIVKQHRKKERELIREGKKSTPYFLKKGDVRKEMIVQQYQEMGSKDRQKALTRRRKKVVAKERREMPSERRGI
ncbi:hypothetical protein AJ80_08497 [Polytolypa hystricis UAMH7299]|uniref:rRNA biogenesis protein RRP36 n=1 Tax=Polytolypa hystricis (strain UAMH7299) TaxID=1447883 RepID=A0A2B7X700_POLH7|nr:hypothetical protein AJ80_08497 [Polytolypa hystricis UAMH7299]